MKRKSILIIAIALVMCLALLAAAACNPQIDPAEQSLSIANSTDLMAKWNVGEADRTVEVTLSDGLKDKAVVITAEPEGIISVDGMNLHAEKAGTATVTATVVLDNEHSFSDSVEIKVTYNYELKITNKSDLTKAFRLGEADRTVNVSLPEAIKDNPVTIKSSKTDVVSVTGNKISAKAKGEATITAETTLNGVKFSDSFKVTVWGEFNLVVSNKTTLEQPIGKYAEPVAIDYKLEEAGDYTDKDVTITSSNTDVAKIENGALVPVNVGTTVVTVACGDKKVTINVTIEVLAELKIANYDKDATYYTGNGEGNGFVLPEVTMAMNSNEQDVKAHVQIIADGLDQTGNKLYASEIGKYTVTYKFDDIEGKPAKELSITVCFVDELFGATGAHVSNESANDALGDAEIKFALKGEAGAYSQVATSTSDKLLFGKLNGSASKVYYAEATFAVNNVIVDGDATLALAHFSSVNERYALLSKLASYSGDFLNIDVTFNSNDNISKGTAIVDNRPANDQTCMFQYKLFSSRRISRLEGDTGVSTETSLVTIAVARDGDYFYTFVNGQYVNCVTPANLRNVDTVPAIVGKWLDKAQVEISGVQYISNAGDVQTKLDELLGVNKEKMMTPYVDSNDGVNSNNYGESFGDNVEINANIQNNGLAFTYTNGKEGLNANDINGSTVGPYVYFDGNFTFSWEYKVTDVMAIADENTADRYRSILELKDHTINYDIVQLGLGSYNNKFATYNGKFRFEANVKGYSNNNGWKQWGEPGTNDAGTTLNDIALNTKVRFSITRILKTDHAEYILTATVLNEDGTPTNKTFTRIVRWGDATVQADKTPANNQGYTTTQKNWAQPVLLYWRNSGVSGEFTNVQWQMLPNDFDVSAIAETTEAQSVTLTKEATTYEVDGEQKATTLNKFSVTFDKLTNGATFNLGEELVAGEYLVKVIAKGDMTAGNGTNNAHDLKQSTVYEDKFTFAEAVQYLSLDGIVLGHGTYEVQLTRIPEPDPVKIMNADDLQAEWIIGGDDREMEIKLGNGVSEDDLTITSSDPTIVEVNGKALKAVAAGNVTITVSVGEGEKQTVTVTLTIHNNYSVAIDNKDALTATYRVGDDDREVATTSTDGTTVSITSSDETVIAITEDGKLHALKKGEATITVTIVEDTIFTDTVKITVWGDLAITVTNKNELEQPIGISDEPHAIVIELVEAADKTLADVTITSGNEAVVTITEDGKLQPVGAGSATITIACQGAESVTINVTVVNAILEIATDKVTHYTNEEFDIPAIVTATDDQGVDKTELVVVTATDGLTLTDSTVNAKATATTIGVYTLTYSLKIGDAEPVTREVQVTIVEDLFGATGAYQDKDINMTTDLVEDGDGYKQVTKFGSDELLYAKLNMTPSQFYYAEAIFAIPGAASDADATVGFGHFSTKNERFAIVSKMSVYSGDYHNFDVDYDKTNNVSIGGASATGQTFIYLYKLLYSRKIAKLEGDTMQDAYRTNLVKIAVAREGDYFYTFINNQYVCCLTPEALRGVDTIPAIIGKYVGKTDTEVSNIVYKSGAADVKAELDQVLGEYRERMFTYFVGGDDLTGTTNYSFATFNNEIKTDSEKSSTGFTYNNMNANKVENESSNRNATVSPYIYFEGNFVFQWDYKADSKKLSAEGYAMLEMLDRTSKNESAQMSLHYDKNVSIDPAAGGKATLRLRNWESGKNDYADISNIPAGVAVRFTLTRILRDDYAEIIMTATVLDNQGNPTDQVYTNTTYNTKGDWKGAAVLNWRNYNISSTFSNIKWSVNERDVQMSIVQAETATATATRLTETITPEEGEPETVNLDKWELVLADMTKDIIIDLGENALEAGEYIVKLTVVRNANCTSGTARLQSIDICQTTLTLATGDRYISLDGITLGHGSYIISFEKIVTPEPTPETPEAPEA